MVGLIHHDLFEIKMNEYVPDAWVILKITTPELTHYRVLAGWYGGYCGADSWKINSGIKEVQTYDNYYDFIGDSGSVYHCNKGCERMSMYMLSIFSQLILV